MSFLAAAGWALAVEVLFEIALAVTEGARPGALGDTVSVTACKLLAYSVVLFAILRVHEPESRIRQVVALRRPPILVALLSGLVGAGLAPGASWLDARMASHFPQSTADTEALERLLAAPTLSKKVALVVGLGILLPLADELFLRGAIFTTLKRGRKGETVLMAVAAFDTLLGASARELVWWFGVALIVSWIRAMSGSVVPSVAARVAFFSVQLAPLVMRAPPKVSNPVVVASVTVAALSLAVVALLCRRDGRALDARLEDG